MILKRHRVQEKISKRILCIFSKELHELVEIESGIGVDVKPSNDPSHVILRDCRAIVVIVGRIVKFLIVLQRIEQLRHVNISIAIHVVELQTRVTKSEPTP